jgi:hypothetical protein
LRMSDHGRASPPLVATPSSRDTPSDIPRTCDTPPPSGVTDQSPTSTAGPSKTTATISVTSLASRSTAPTVFPWRHAIVRSRGRVGPYGPGIFLRPTRDKAGKWCHRELAGRIDPPRRQSELASALGDPGRPIQEEILRPHLGTGGIRSGDSDRHQPVPTGSSRGRIDEMVDWCTSRVRPGRQSGRRGADGALCKRDDGDRVLCGQPVCRSADPSPMLPRIALRYDGGSARSSVDQSD